MLEKLLSNEEGKTLEFKENTQSLQKIVQTVIAFANTAGGTLIVGVRDKTKEVVGLKNVLEDEQKIANAVAESVAPLLIPNLQLHTWRGRDLLIVQVAHSFQPYYLKVNGLEKGTYIRLGASNRLADQHTITEIQQLRGLKYFDERPNSACPLSEIQFALAKRLFSDVAKSFTDKTARSLDLVVEYQGRKLPTNGAVLLFGKQHLTYFPDARIRLGRFIGLDKAEILDTLDLEVPLTVAIEQILMFIRRHTTMGAKFGELRRKNVPQYATGVVREAITNALLHADYSLPGASITVAIFDDRMEITNPGALPYGLTLEDALAGISQLRNRVIGRVFRELDLIEQWGSGLRRMLQICEKERIRPPKFEERGAFFRVTIYHAMLSSSQSKAPKQWQELIEQYLVEHQKISAKQAQKIWQVTARTTSTRLKQLCEAGLLVNLATSAYDPRKSFALASAVKRRGSI